MRSSLHPTTVSRSHTHYLCRSTRGEIPWQAEQAYIVPNVEKDSLPHAHEGNRTAILCCRIPSLKFSWFPYRVLVRNLSEVQESAQYLAGESLPLTFLNGLLQKSSVEPATSTSLVCLNLTPYDGWLERVCKRFHQNGHGEYTIRTLSLTKHLPIAQFVEKALAVELLEVRVAVENLM